VIQRQDILDRAAEWNLRADVVEKDYVLGWLLAGLGLTPATRAAWIFKGGTCIKKCYVETYRFSEDLDFSLLPEAPYTAEEIGAALEQATRTASELSGIDFPRDLIEVRPRLNQQGESTFQGRIAYRGPLAIPTFPRVLIDITRHEAVLDAPTPRRPFHGYPDDDQFPDVTVLAYSLHELLAEKTRALYERTRPRDLYDVVYLLENRAEELDPGRLHELFHEKCQNKVLARASVALLLHVIHGDEELKAEWANMLAHQLPQLPPIEDLLARLPRLLPWVDVPAPAVGLPLGAVPVPATMERLAPAGIRYWGGVPLERVRFAAANRLLVEFLYDGVLRRVEPYSLRRAGTGNLLLYGWEKVAGHIKAFNVARMHDVRPTTIAFMPRYRIEFTSSGPLSAPATASVPRTAFPPRATPRSRAGGFGHTYIFECPYCQKRFRRSTNDADLRKHKTKDGWDCSGRHGQWVDTQY
jgi:predicted nucleotidyltransferase component of viral defense system